MHRPLSLSSYHTLRLIRYLRSAWLMYILWWFGRELKSMRIRCESHWAQQKWRCTLQLVVTVGIESTGQVTHKLLSSDTSLDLLAYMYICSWLRRCLSVNKWFEWWEILEEVLAVSQETVVLLSCLELSKETPAPGLPRELLNFHLHRFSCKDRDKKLNDYTYAVACIKKTIRKLAEVPRLWILLEILSKDLCPEWYYPLCWRCDREQFQSLLYHEMRFGEIVQS